MDSIQDEHMEKKELYSNASAAEPKELENTSMGTGKTIGEAIYNYLMYKISLKGRGL